MDCNSYSYAPYMLEDNTAYIEQYENDDMSATIEKAARGNVGHWEDGYIVYGTSYDGSLDICEFFRTIDAARHIYNEIVNRYSFSPPAAKKEVRELINETKRIDKKGA